jgi:NCS1 family nucleobase:cation symporter-1
VKTTAARHQSEDTGSSTVLQVEARGIEPVSDFERTGAPRSLFTLWFGANVEFATLVTGVLATGAFGLSFWEAFLALGLGNLVGAAFLAALSTPGARLGIPQLIQSRRSFGLVGTFFPGALNFVSGCSWFAVNTVLGVFAMEELFGVDFGLGLAIMVVLQVLIAVVGYHLIHTVERWLAWVLTAVFIVVSFYAFGHHRTDYAFHPKIAGSLGFSGAFILTVSISFSYVLGWVPYASDYTRYLPRSTSPRKIAGYVFASMLISGLWLESVGAAFGTTAFLDEPAQLVKGLLPHTFGEITMVAVIIGTITANVLNIYSGALSSLVLRIPLKRWMAALIVGAVGTVVSWIAGQHNYWQHYENFLFFLGYWVAPWMAIVTVDLLLTKRGRYAEVSQFFETRPSFRVGFFAWLVAIICSTPFMNQTLFHGFIASHHPGLGDITYYVSFVVAGLVYSVAMFVTRRRSITESVLALR